MTKGPCDGVQIPGGGEKGNQIQILVNVSQFIQIRSDVFATLQAARQCF